MSRSTRKLRAADLLFLAAVLPGEFVEVVVDLSGDGFVEEAPEFG